MQSRVMKSEMFMKVGDLRVQAYLARLKNQVVEAELIEAERQQILDDPKSYEEVKKEGITV